MTTAETYSPSLRRANELLRTHAETQLESMIKWIIEHDPDIEILSLGGTGRTGYIPQSIWKLSKLEVLDLGSNFIGGYIPDEIGQLPRLRTLNLCHNELGGGIPSSLGNLSNLEFLYLHNNELSGSIPNRIGDLESLRHFTIHVNPKMGGDVPPALLKKLEIDVTGTGIHEPPSQLLKRAIMISERMAMAGVDSTRIAACLNMIGIPNSNDDIWTSESVEACWSKHTKQRMPK